jgi:hypothetical protein
MESLLCCDGGFSLLSDGEDGVSPPEAGIAAGEGIATGLSLAP